MQNARELWVPRLCLVKRNPGMRQSLASIRICAPMAAHSYDATGPKALSHILVTGITAAGCRLAPWARKGNPAAGYADGGAAGSRTANSVRPGLDATSTVPPWASTIDWTMDRPSPLVPSDVGAAVAVP
jgi:hypothetical protein